MQKRATLRLPVALSSLIVTGSNRYALLSRRAMLLRRT